MTDHTRRGATQGVQPPAFFWIILIVGIVVAITGVIVQDDNPVLGWTISAAGVVGATAVAFLVAKKKGYPTRR